MAWGKVTSALSVVVAAALGGTIYAWGAGWFWPCETLGRPFSAGACEKITTITDRSVGPFALLPNGNLLLATSGQGTDPTDPPSLVEIAPATGETLGTTVLTSLPPDARPVIMALNADASQIALSNSYERAVVVSRDGTTLATLDRWLPAYLAFDDKGYLLLDMGRNPDGLPSQDSAEAWDMTNPGTQPVAITPADTTKLFRQGINAAISADGTFAQLIDHVSDSPITGLRVGKLGMENAPGSFFGVSLRAGCSHATGEVAFSPFGYQLAAEFSCPERWGQVSSALVVWDYEKNVTLLTVPTIDYFDDLVWQDTNTLLASRYNFGPKTTDLLRIAVPDAK